MAQPIEELLLEAIEKDDIKAFGEMMKESKCGGYRLGRFPVLSLMYLCKSRKIIAKYEADFIKITSWEELREPASVANRFSESAGKCLRLYLSETVSPLEMLLILDDTKRLRRVYPLTKASSGVKERLKTIYQVKHSLEIKYEGSQIILDRRPLNRGEKKKIITICLCSVLAAAVAVAVPVTAVSLAPNRAAGEVTKLRHIKFGGQKTYTLIKDITVPANYNVEKMNCTIVGNGHKLIFERGARIGELNGKLQDAEIISYGSPLFTAVTEKAEISGVTVNATVDATVNEGSAFIAVNNYGTINNVTLNVSGKVTVVKKDSDVTLGGMVLNNHVKYNAFSQARYGIIENCTVTYSGFSLEGEASANGLFAGIVGTNGGIVKDSTVKGSIVSDTVDLAGVCHVNNYGITGVVNEATLYQTSSSDGWSPIVCGIAVENNYVVEYSENRGAVSAKSTCGKVEETPTVTTAGIVYKNEVKIEGCKNSGTIFAEGSGSITAAGIFGVSYGTALSLENVGAVSAVGDEIYSGGICSSNQGTLQECRNSGAISANGSGEVYVGGIASVMYGYIYKSLNEGAISAVGAEAYVGGISAYCGAQILNCIAVGDISVVTTKAYVGGIYGFSRVYQSGMYIPSGSAEYCISKSKISVTSTDKNSCVGGIAGYIQEEGFTQIVYDDDGKVVKDEEGNPVTEVVYYGGKVTNCIFLGGCELNDGLYGNIVGVSGANIYETNEYGSGDNVKNNFKDNYYIDNSLPSFGAAQTQDEEFVAVDGKEATPLPANEIEELEDYKSILAEFGDLKI